VTVIIVFLKVVFVKGKFVVEVYVALNGVTANKNATLVNKMEHLVIRMLHRMISVVMFVILR